MPPVLSNALRRVRTSGKNPALNGAAPRWGWTPSLTSSGRTFDSSKATSIAAVRRAVNIIAQPISTFPLHVYAGGGEDQRERSEDESNAVIWRRPNPEVSRAVFWETVIAHEVLRGNAFIFVVKDRAGRPLELWPIEPQRVGVGRLDDGRKVYQIDNLDPMLDFSQGGEIIHVIGPTSDGLRGISPLSEGADDFEQALIMREFSSRYFSNDSSPGGVLSTDQPLTTEQAEELQARWEARHSGGANARRPAVLGMGTQWQTVSFNPEESQLLESRGMALGETGRRFGIPPHLLGDVERSTSWGTGIEEQTGEFYVFTLLPHMIRFEQAIDDSLLRDTGEFVRWNPDAVLRADTLKRYQAYEIGIRAKFLVPNDARRKENLPDLPGGDLPIAPAPAQQAPPRSIAASVPVSEGDIATMDLAEAVRDAVFQNGNGH